LSSQVLSVENLSISFGANHVLRSVSFDLGNNEILGVIGPNGAGKTVLLNILTGILNPSSGHIHFLGQDVTHKTINERCRMGFGRTFQVPRSFEGMTVFENVIVGAVYGSGVTEKIGRRRALEILHMIGLADKAGWFARKLSLIDRKRLEIGRALATDPKVLFLDEVAAGLTETEVDKLLAIVRLIKQQGVSIVWIEHVLQTMREGTDRILCLADGRVVKSGVFEEVIGSKELLECYMGADEC
jgi:branched-chain amino acid transport system ATP-binding protein